MIGLIIAAVLAALILLIIFLPVIGWSIIGLIVFIILLVLIVPIGADVGYVGGELSLAARANGFSYKLLPKKPKDDNKAKKEKPKKEKKAKKPKKEKPKKEKAEGEKLKKKLDFTPEEIIELLKKVFSGLGKFGKLTVHHFMLHYVAAGKDPYSTALTFNYVNAALSSLAPICAQKFIVKGDVDVWTDVDFAETKPKIDAEISITLRLIQIVHMALAVVFGALGVLIKNKIRLFKEKLAAKKEKKVSREDINPEENKETNNIKTEERMDSNGK